MTYSARKKSSVLPGCWVRLLYSLPPRPLKILTNSCFLSVSGGRPCENLGSPTHPPSNFFPRGWRPTENPGSITIRLTIFSSLWVAAHGKSWLDHNPFDYFFLLVGGKLRAALRKSCVENPVRCLAVTFSAPRKILRPALVSWCAHRSYQAYIHKFRKSSVLPAWCQNIE